MCDRDHLEVESCERVYAFVTMNGLTELYNLKDSAHYKNYKMILGICCVDMY